MSPLGQIEGLLRREIGLDLQSIGENSLRRAVEKRIASIGNLDLHAYAQKVASCSKEADALIEELVVPETWFFRDSEAFTYVVERAREWRYRSASTFEVLSAPCATGEEVFSTAMGLVEGGLSDFHVTGWDISADAIRYARQGVFGNRSFRNALTGKDRFFSSVGDGRFSIADSLRTHVEFERRNLLDPPPARYFNIIFCRNLFIYLDPPSRERLVGYLRGMLVKGGSILVAPSEQQLMRESGLEAVGFTGAYAFREPVEKPVKPPAIAPLRPATHYPVLPTRRVFPLPMATRRITRPVRRAPEPKPLSLADARKLADAAHFEEAWRMCEELDRREGASAELLYLKGLVRDAQGQNNQAAELYGQAVYMDPAHAEALSHLALVKERLGDKVAAERLRARASRAVELAERKGGS